MFYLGWLQPAGSKEDIVMTAGNNTGDESNEEEMTHELSKQLGMPMTLPGQATSTAQSKQYHSRNNNSN